MENDGGPIRSGLGLAVVLPALSGHLIWPHFGPSGTCSNPTVASRYWGSMSEMIRAL